MEAAQQTSSSELEGALAEMQQPVEEPAPTPSSTAPSPGELPSVSPTDSESEPQEDRASEDPAETAAEGEGEETGDIAGSEIPEGEGILPGSVGVSETSTGEGDTPIGMPSEAGEPTADKKNPRDPNKPKMPALGHPSSEPPQGEAGGEATGPEGSQQTELGGTSSTVAEGDEVEIKTLADEVFKRGEKKGGLQEYLPQLPPEFRNQIKDYYEVLAQ
ncbi:MAG: hypothetical protein H8E30_08050 [Alphaproteobacteria bacterium]|nr:hypothetical protein [Alphaproteobacteria bacterium]